MRAPCGPFVAHTQPCLVLALLIPALTYVSLSWVWLIGRILHDLGGKPHNEDPISAKPWAIAKLIDSGLGRHLLGTTKDLSDPCAVTVRRLRSVRTQDSCSKQTTEEHGALVSVDVDRDLLTQPWPKLRAIPGLDGLDE